MAILHACYVFLGEVTEEEFVVVRLPPSVIAELKMLATLSPCMVSNLGAEFANRIVASDASPFGEGAAAAPVPRRLVAELWRHRDHCGA